MMRSRCLARSPDGPTQPRLAVAMSRLQVREGATTVVEAASRLAASRSVAMSRVLPPPTAPDVRPRTIERCTAKNAIISGSVVIVAAGHHAAPSRS
jgi:hypothetical protein